MLSTKSNRKRVHFAANVRDNNAETPFKKQQAERRAHKARKAKLKKIRDVIYTGLNSRFKGTLERGLSIANISPSDAAELFDSQYSEYSNKVFQRLMYARVSEFDYCVRNVIPIERLSDALSKDSYLMLEKFIRIYASLVDSARLGKMHEKNMICTVQVLMAQCPETMRGFIDFKRSSLSTRPGNSSQEEKNILSTIEEICMQTIASHTAAEEESCSDTMDCSENLVGTKRASALTEHPPIKRQRLETKAHGVLPAFDAAAAREASSQTSPLFRANNIQDQMHVTLS